MNYANMYSRPDQSQSPNINDLVNRQPKFPNSEQRLAVPSSPAVDMSLESLQSYKDAIMNIPQWSIIVTAIDTYLYSIVDAIATDISHSILNEPNIKKLKTPNSYVVLAVTVDKVLDNIVCKNDCQYNPQAIIDMLSTIATVQQTLIQLSATITNRSTPACSQDTVRFKSNIQILPAPPAGVFTFGPTYDLRLFNVLIDKQLECVKPILSAVETLEALIRSKYNKPGTQVDNIDTLNRFDVLINVGLSKDKKIHLEFGSQFKVTCPNVKPSKSLNDALDAAINTDFQEEQSSI